jgi:hypothetical protein
VGCKEKNIPEAKRGEFGVGDVWTWTALDADTNLMICWRVDERDARAAARHRSGPSADRGATEA